MFDCNENCKGMKVKNTFYMYNSVKFWFIFGIILFEWLIFFLQFQNFHCTNLRYVRFLLDNLLLFILNLKKNILVFLIKSYFDPEMVGALNGVNYRFPSIFIIFSFDERRPAEHSYTFHHDEAENFICFKDAKYL